MRASVVIASTFHTRWSRLGAGHELGLAITYLPEPVLRGTGGPLLPLRDYFAGEPFLILNGDTIMDLDLPAMIAIHRERGGLSTMALRKTTAPEAYSQIEVDSKWQIRRMRFLVDHARAIFKDYPDLLPAELATSLTAFMYCGAMICEPAIFDMM